MPPKPTLEDKLARIGALGQAPLTAEGMLALVKALGDASNLVVARAAGVMGAAGHDEFIMPLEHTLQRMLALPGKDDPYCRAKLAIVRALDALGDTATEPFILASRCVQMEPVYGGRQDTAGALRAECAVILARLQEPEARYELVRLLLDPEPQPRLAAVSALGYLGGEASELLLRMKVLTGDAEPSVISKCLLTLLELDFERALPFTRDFLDSGDNERIELAALALGETHDARAFAVLRDYWDRHVDYSLNKTLLLALALTRCDAAVDFLLDRIRGDGRSTAVKAVQALAIYAGDDRIRARIHDAVQATGDAKVAEVFAEEFKGV